MMNTRRLVSIFLFVLFFALAANAQVPNQRPSSVPDIAGEWSGTWGTYSPAQGTTPPKDMCKSLTAKVEKTDATYVATFEGDCGRPYKYTIKMEGRLVGNAVMFKGTTDLGARDGGVFDWIGRATDKEFVGFFTSAYYTGTFNLTKSAAPKQ